MSERRERAWPVVAGAVVLFLGCAWTTDHYWDEYYYLFSVSRHSVETLLAFEPSLSDGIFPNGFFSGKLAFVVLLRSLVSLTGTDPAGLFVLRSLFASMTIGVAFATWRVLLLLVDDRRLALEAAAILLVLPLTVYLGFKVMSEVPALLAATLGGWQLLEAVRAPDSRARSRGLVLAAVGLGSAAVFRPTSVLFAAGLVSAAVIARPGGATVRRIITDAALALSAAMVLVAAIFILAVGDPLTRFGSLAQSVTSRSPGGLVVIYAIAVFAQLFVVLLLAALRPMTRTVAAALAWLAVALMPYVITAQYVEPRFFYTGLPAFALLAAIGLENLSALTQASRRAALAAAMIAILAVLDRALFATLMPYEIREGDYSALIEDVDTQRPQATLVVPWLSDFCYLSLAFPDRRVVLAMSETYGTGTVFQTRDFQQWVGASAYAGAAEDLERQPAPRVYAGWEYSPTVVALDRYLRPLRLAYLDDPDRRARLLNHLTPSWVWNSDRYRLEPIAARGAYRAFTIEKRHGS